MRLISFMLTKDQVLAQTKTQTRRVGSERLKVGDRLRGVLKCQGRARKCECGGYGCDDGKCQRCWDKGRYVEPLVDLAIVEVTAIRRERLDLITQEDVIAEGFPGMTTAGFTGMFCKHMRVKPWTVVTVITFRYLDGEIYRAVRAGLPEDIAAAAVDHVQPSRVKPGTIEAVRAAVDRETAKSLGIRVRKEAAK